MPLINNGIPYGLELGLQKKNSFFELQFFFQLDIRPMRQTYGSMGTGMVFFVFKAVEAAGGNIKKKTLD